jgi:glycosyltransferase involved in cell wall biosynthesis
LAEALETFTALAKRGRDVTITLAGPVQSRRSQELIDEATANYPGRVDSIGPVYGDEKRTFFDDIDVFLFPTKAESWGLVLNEALAEGVPVITYDRGCTSIVVGNSAGHLIDRQANFAESAASQVEQWMDDADSYRAASEAAVAQARQLHETSEHMLGDFVEHMFSPLEHSSAEW